MNQTIKNRIIAVVIIGCMLAGTFGAVMAMMNPGSTEQTDQEMTEESAQAKEENSDAKKARASVTGYFNALQKGEMQKADALMADKSVNVLELDTAYEEFKKSIADMSEEAKNTADTYYRESMKENVRDYMITTSELEEDQAVYTVILTSVDMSNVKEIDPEDSAAQVNQYVEENQSELWEKMNTEGEDAVNDYLSNMQLQIYYEQVLDQMKKAPSMELELEVISEKIDGEWLITSINIL